MLGRGAPTSPGHFRNTAHPIARATARNRAIAHTNVPSNAGRSRPDHHAPDVHGAGTERAARTPGRELLDVLTDDHSSGPRAQTTAVRHYEGSYSRQRRGRVTAWNFSRFRRNRREAARTPSCCIGCSSTRAGVLPQVLFGAGATDKDPPGPRACGLPPQREARHAGGSPPAGSATAGVAARPPATIRPWPGRRTRPTPRPDNAAPQPNSLRGYTFADNAHDPKLVNELIGERRAEALAEDRAADAPRPRPGR